MTSQQSFRPVDKMAYRRVTNGAGILQHLTGLGAQLALVTEENDVPRVYQAQFVTDGLLGLHVDSEDC